MGRPTFCNAASKAASPARGACPSAVHHPTALACAAGAATVELRVAMTSASPRRLGPMPCRSRLGSEDRAGKTLAPGRKPPLGKARVGAASSVVRSAFLPGTRLTVKLTRLAAAHASTVSLKSRHPGRFRFAEPENACVATRSERRGWKSAYPVPCCVDRFWCTPFLGDHFPLWNPTFFQVLA